MTLWSDFLSNRKRVAHKWTHYFPVYERHFGRYANTDVVLFEIGCGQGGSLQMWKQYLGPYARIVGIDNRPECAAYAEHQIEIRIGDQADSAFLDGVCDEFGSPDIVIDDGSHIMEHVNASFTTLYPRLERRGVYLVEDMQTAYWPNYGGGLRRPDTFVERCKGLVDELNARSSRGALPPTEFTRTTLSMHFYANVVVFEKGRTGPLASMKTGKGTRNGKLRKPKTKAE
ncbi:MAG: class I SAM-dependent methyltransferase [Bauldia sp.]|nr:class I SAM-dependent methyltransferase [Bauldia sp.]